MITVVCFLLVLGSVPLLGGDLRRLGDIRLLHVWTIGVAMVLQVAVLFVFDSDLSPVAAGALHLVSYAPLMGFAWLNRGISGMPIIASGGLLNLLAIGANGGVMPARPGALETAGLADEADAFRNSAAVDEPKLAFLGDVFAIPDAVPFANVFSVGDVLLVIGAAVLLHSVTGSRVRLAKPSESHTPEPRQTTEGAVSVAEQPLTASRQETIAILDFCDSYASESAPPMDIPVLARHVYALGLLDQASSIRFAAVAKHCAEHPLARTALSDDRVGLPQVLLLARALLNAPAAYERDEGDLLAMASHLNPSQLEAALVDWIQQSGNEPTTPVRTVDRRENGTPSQTATIARQR